MAFHKPGKLKVRAVTWEREKERESMHKKEEEREERYICK